MRIHEIIVADDHAVVRVGLQLILDETTDLAIMDEAENGQELLDKLRVRKYDLVILDISMPGTDAMEVLKEIRTCYPEMPVVIFSMNPGDVYAIRMLTGGASAYINKETNPDKIIEVLRTVLSGKKYYFPEHAEMMAEIIHHPERRNVLLHETLTDREFQIFALLASGVRKSEIALKLGISKSTVNNHRSSILKKMNMSINPELTKYAIQHRIIQ